MTTTFETLEESSSPETDVLCSDRHARIQIRAYEPYLAPAEASGNELDDWLQAELEIDNE